MPSLDERSPAFRSAAAYAVNAPAASKAPNATKLELYALYKYLTVSHTPNTTCPSIWDMTARAKWQAWEKAGREWEGKVGDGELEERYVAIVRGFGWVGDEGERKTDEARNDDESDDDDEESATKSGGGPGMGRQVSQMARPGQEESEKDDVEEDGLHGAVLSGDVGKVRAFLNAEFAGSIGGDTVINKKDEYGFTPLHLAADRGFLPIVELLVSRGADTSITDDDGFTALSLAEGASHEEIATYLRSRAAEGG